MRIYTKTGDDGETGLFGGGRVSKADARVEAYGTLDELNSILGWSITQQPDSMVAAQLHAVQSDLFVLGAHLATPNQTRGRKPQLPDLPERRIAELELEIDRMEQGLPPLQTFILPGGSAAGAAIHYGRTVCRRAERRIAALAAVDTLDRIILVYLNRLSDYLFVLARHVNHAAGTGEQSWP